MKSLEELGISKIPIEYEKTINTLSRAGEVDISSLDKASKIALQHIGKKTGAFQCRKASILERITPFKIIGRNHKNIRIQKTA